MEISALKSTVFKSTFARKTSPRILIDATCVTREKAGVGVYAFNLIQDLVRCNTKYQIYLLIQGDDPDLSMQHERLTIVRVPSSLGRKVWIRCLCEQIVLPLLLSGLRIDILHSIHYSFPLLKFGTRQVVTLHDMTSFKMPEVHTRLKVPYFRTFIRLAAKAADHLIFVSNSTQSDFVTIFGPKIRASTVTHLGKDDRFNSGISGEHIEILRGRYSLPEKYVLYVGTLEPRKNLVRLVQAFKSIAIKHEDLSLVIAGKKGWMFDDLFALAASTGLQSRVIFTGFVAEDDKPALIAGATIFAYPSLYEGFGIPVLEALACGIPVVTSNISSIPEVAGDAAILIDPYNVQEIADALDRLMCDSDLRLHLSEKGISQASKFTWRNTSATTLQVYERCLPVPTI